MMKKEIWTTIAGCGLIFSMGIGLAQAQVLHGIPGGNFSSPFFPDGKPYGSVTGGQWDYYQVASTTCDVLGSGEARHGEVRLDWGWRGASLWYTDTGTTPLQRPWRISADVRGSLLYYEAKSPRRTFSLGDANGTTLLSMAVYPDKTVTWSTPTGSGTVTLATGIDGSVDRKVCFDYHPVTGAVRAGLAGQIVFSQTTTPGLSVARINFQNYAPVQGASTFFVDNVTAYEISIPGDVNLDGVVDAADAAVITANLGMGPGATWTQGDLDGNGGVDAADQKIVTANLGQHEVPISTRLTGIIPEPKQVSTFNGTWSPFVITASTTLVVDRNAGPLAMQGAAMLQEDLQILYNRTVPIVTPSLNWGKPGFVLCNDVNQVPWMSARVQTVLSSLPIRGAESYRLAGDDQSVVIDAPAGAGLFYGMQTLRQMLRSDGTIPAMVIADWPDQAIRACYLPVLSDYTEWIKKMARLKMNMCILESWWYAGGNWWYNPYGENRTKALAFMELCQQYGIEPVPLVQGLGWAYGVVDQNPNCSEGIWVQDELKTLNGTTPVNLANPNVIRTASAPIVVTNTSKTMTYVEGIDYQIIPGVTARKFETTNTPWKIARISTGRIPNNQSVLVNYNYMNYCPNQSPYCPSEPLTYQIVDSTLTNIINIYKPKYIHIGHDEVIYYNRCQRCQQSGKTSSQLIGDDIVHWYNKIKSLDPTVKVMMWDDLVRQNFEDGGVMPYVPDDVILCPWVYTTGSSSITTIQNRLNWFITTNQRPTLGVSSGYWNENIRIWKDAVLPYASNPTSLGVMYAWWGEPPICSGLSFAGEWMWSQARMDNILFNLYSQADSICRTRGVALLLSLYDQRTVFAQWVNSETAAGRDARIDAETWRQQLASIAQQVGGSIVADLNSAHVAAGTVPERSLTQMEAIPAYAWTMATYVQAQRFHAQGQKSTALALLVQMADRFKFWHFHGHTQADQWVSAYQDNNIFPTAQEMFNVTLVLSQEPVLSGDANGDGVVDVGDLGILAANYGQSGKSWSEGDFNGDSLVDVGDLGILAAHYGTGTSDANWDADYAMTFGTTVNETSVDDNSRSLCSFLGLPLVTGLVLMGLMLGKLKEDKVV
jgi:hypothetical protein